LKTGEQSSNEVTGGEMSQGEGESDSDVAEIESESEDTSAAQDIETGSTYVTKDQTIWNKKPPPQVYKTSSQNVLRQRSGPHRSTEFLSIRDTFTKIITIEMVDLKVRYTNKKAQKVYDDYNEKNPNSQRSWKPVTSQELYAFFGILICSGVNNSNTDHTTEMWKSTSYPLYRAVMNINKFRLMLKFIRFDDVNTRAARSEMDKLAPISDVWNILNSNLSKMYKPTANLTIDEQLYPFRGHTKFTQYIPSKPAKYGIKI